MLTNTQPILCIIYAIFYFQPSFGQSNLLLGFTILRVVFIPLLMFCNAQPRHNPVMFNSDIYPVVFILLLGLTNGYLGTLSMMFGPKYVHVVYIIV